MDINKPTLQKEVWRNPDGSFAKAPQLVITKAPAEPETKKEDGGVLIALLLFGASVVTAAIVYWQITITIASIVILGCVVRSYIKSSKQKLVINYCK